MTSNLLLLLHVWLKRVAVIFVRACNDADDNASSNEEYNRMFAQADLATCKQMV